MAVVVLRHRRLDRRNRPLAVLIRRYLLTTLKAFGARVGDAGTCGVFNVFGIATSPVRSTSASR